jgi:hypothetical protein
LCATFAIDGEIESHSIIIPSNSTVADFLDLVKGSQHNDTLAFVYRDCAAIDLAEKISDYNDDGAILICSSSELPPSEDYMEQLKLRVQSNICRSQSGTTKSISIRHLEIPIRPLFTVSLTTKQFRTTYAIDGEIQLNIAHIPADVTVEDFLNSVKAYHQNDTLAYIYLDRAAIDLLDQFCDYYDRGGVYDCSPNRDPPSRDYMQQLLSTHERTVTMAHQKEGNHRHLFICFQFLLEELLTVKVSRQHCLA